MQRKQLSVRFWARSVLVVLLLTGFGGLVGCKTVEVDRGHDHHDFHDDHHDHY